MTKFTDSKRPAHLPPGPTALWDWIEDHALNQRQAAQLIGLPHVTINHYLHNRRRPGLAHADTIFRKTGIKAAVWLETRVGKSKKVIKSRSGKTADFPNGNAHA